MRGAKCHVRRVLNDDVNNPKTAYRYQNAFLWEKYQSYFKICSEHRDTFQQLEAKFEEELGFDFVMTSLSHHKPNCRVVVLNCEMLEQLVFLSKNYAATTVLDVMTHPHWHQLVKSFAVQCQSTTLTSLCGDGYFVRTEDTSFKEFECYFSVEGAPRTKESVSTQPSIPILPSPLPPPPPAKGRMPSAVPTTESKETTPAAERIYTRPGDIPFAQRRKFKYEIQHDLSVPAVLDEPELCHMKGIGPYKTWNQIVAALVVDEKTQTYIRKRLERGSSLKLYLMPWDFDMCTDREIRVYVCNFEVVAMSSWNPFGRQLETGNRKAFEWIEELSDDELERLGNDIASFVEKEVVCVMKQCTSLTSCTVDVLVLPTPDGFTIKLVETGSFGAYMHAGSTLFHWDETNVLGSQDETEFHSPPSSTFEFRVLTDKETGERLSITHPVPKPDLLCSH